MNQTFVRRAAMGSGLWRLFRYQSQPCRWLPLTIAPDNERTPGHDLDAARWLGNVRIGGRGHHALFVPPGCHALYRFVAPPHSRVVVWCGVVSDGLVDPHGIEFVAAVRREQASQDLAVKLRVTPDPSSADHRWRKRP